ncbi:MAG: hypothetical protein GY772_22860, partial [bacterium]|nr:hypothetical protein [bacterium]
GGAHQHFGGWLMDYLTAAEAVRMGLGPRIKKYTAVKNEIYAEVAAGTWQKEDGRIQLSPKSQERLGNVFETLGGLWFLTGNLRALRRFSLFLTLHIHRADLPDRIRGRAAARFIAHRSKQRLPILISAQLQEAGA